MYCDSFCNQSSYNTYEGLDQLPYNIICKLMERDEDIWKLLKYNTQDALQKPNLTIDEKSKLIFNTTGDSEEYRVFRTKYIDDAQTEEIQMLRIYINTIYPTNISMGVVSFSFECIAHNKIMNLDNYKNRVEVMVQRVIQALNGQDIGGIGKLNFSRDGSFYDVAAQDVWNNRNFQGITIIMSMNYGKSQNDGC